jgi:DNA repair exonuclease SbcCD ATPase subunit
MLTRMFSLQPVLAIVVATALLIGCGQSSDRQQTPIEGKTPQASSEAADPHDVPLTEEEIARLKEETARYEDAIAHIRQYQRTIQQEATAGEPAKAHRALDNLDVVLERLPEAARDSGVPRDRWQAVNETAQNLRELFDQVHARIDAGETPDYESFADEIDRGIQTLAAIEPEQTE